MKILCVTSRSCSVLLDPEGLYEAREKRELFLNGERLGEEYRSSVNGLYINAGNKTITGS